MMQNNEKSKKNNETPSLLSYVAVKEQLMMQASSLLDDRTIESMLEEEKSNLTMLPALDKPCLFAASSHYCFRLFRYSYSERLE